ncbi:MAG: 2-amino-4-hydroxy-6-hydroxymethyldihydropteridine diphosphokinase [Chloroflexi bacterium]|nr:2-amino-4-hydroxy-6-hydroxymethyldihydropteridine diphosphokinase [Chloroflexota bacterium]
MTLATVGLGSNLDPERRLAFAIERLRALGTLVAVSSTIQTAPVGYLDQPDYLNAVARLEIDMTPEDFKQSLYAIEREAGRDRVHQLTPYGPVELDLDLLLWGDSVLTFGSKPWRVPARGILEHAFVAVPLAEIAPDERHPETGETYAQIAARLAAC